MNNWKEMYDVAPSGRKRDFVKGFGHYFSNIGKKKKIYLHESTKLGLLGLLTGKIAICFLIGSILIPPSYHYTREFINKKPNVIYLNNTGIKELTFNDYIKP